ncbi:hypothetical protein ACFQ88_15255 [Paenibacillus sp. NPDC056579]|nr:hypothetical protein [Paenibacillus sp. H1-7]
MMNLFDLELQMKERQQEMEKQGMSVWAVQIPMLDWLLGTAAVCTFISIL